MVSATTSARSTVSEDAYLAVNLAVTGFFRSAGVAAANRPRGKAWARLLVDTQPLLIARYLVTEFSLRQ